MRAMNRRTASVVVMLALAGCDSAGMGGGSTSGDTQSMNHLLANDHPSSVAMGAYLDHPFWLPLAATVSFQIAASSPPSPDVTADLLANSEFYHLMKKEPYRGFAPATGTAPLRGLGTLPAGGYHFVVLCQDANEPCQFTYTLNLFY
jgi:hypothetical protein